MASSSSWKAFERKCAKELGQWWDGDPKKIRRLPLKNGWVWDGGRGPDIVRLNDPDAKTPSDNVIDYTFPLFVECKKRKSLKLHELIGEPPKKKSGDNLQGWWLTTCGRADVGKVFPLLFAKFPGSHKTFLIMPASLTSQIHFVRGIRASIPESEGYCRGKGIMIFEANEFFKKVDASEIKNKIKELQENQRRETGTKAS